MRFSWQDLHYRDQLISYNPFSIAVTTIKYHTKGMLLFSMFMR